jgi:hypothetical protein
MQSCGAGSIAGNDLADGTEDDDVMRERQRVHNSPSALKEDVVVIDGINKSFGQSCKFTGLGKCSDSCGDMAGDSFHQPAGHLQHQRLLFVYAETRREPM